MGLKYQQSLFQHPPFINKVPWADINSDLIKGKNPTPATPVQASSHLTTTMNNVISSVFPEQAMEGYRPKT